MVNVGENSKIPVEQVKPITIDQNKFLILIVELHDNFSHNRVMKLYKKNIYNYNDDINKRNKISILPHFCISDKATKPLFFHNFTRS